MNNVSEIKNCYGCGVCSKACSKGLISIVLNEDGFYEPRIQDKDACSNCGLCMSVCSFLDNNLAVTNDVTSSYAAWSNDPLVRRKCSSGGVAFEVSRFLLDKGFNICCVRYNTETNRAEHYIAKNIKELIPGIGSKYIQSYTESAFKAIDRNQKHLVIGTPCQIDSLRRYLRKFRCEDNFILMDFYCHGVPSKLMWDKYLNEAKKKVGKITYVSWRNKSNGWHDSWAMSIDGEVHGEPVNWQEDYDKLIREKKSYLNSRLSQGDSFYRLFLSNSCLGPACYEQCKYKACCSSADIRVGDLWGRKFSENEDGISAVLAFTMKGKSILESSNLHLEDQPISVVAEAQMNVRTKKHISYRFVMSALKNSHLNLNALYYMYIYPIRLMHIPIGAYNRIKRLFHK